MNRQVFSFMMATEKYSTMLLGIISILTELKSVIIYDFLGWKCLAVLVVAVKTPADGNTHPRLPALDVRLHSEVLCLSCDFMMMSCLCFRSRRMALNSSSSHRSKNEKDRGQEGSHPSTATTKWNHGALLFFASKTQAGYKTRRMIECVGAANIPMGVSSRNVLALRLAPWDTSSSATCIWRSNNSGRCSVSAPALIWFLLPVCLPHLTPARCSMKRLPSVWISQVHAAPTLQQQLGSLDVAVCCGDVELKG